MTTPPSGWLECNGAAVSRATYSTLFVAIGTTFGSGDGTTTFNLPDLRGYFVRGYDNGRGIDSGRVFGSTQADTIVAHNHVINISDPGHTHVISCAPISGGGGPGTYNGSTGTVVLSANGTINSATTGITATSNNTGGTETRPKNIALMYCIKT